MNTKPSGPLEKPTLGWSLTTLVKICSQSTFCLRVGSALSTRSLTSWKVIKSLRLKPYFERELPLRIPSSDWSRISTTLTS